MFTLVNWPTYAPVFMCTCLHVCRSYYKFSEDKHRLTYLGNFGDWWLLFLFRFVSETLALWLRLLSNSQSYLILQVLKLQTYTTMPNILATTCLATLQTIEFHILAGVQGLSLTERCVHWGNIKHLDVLRKHIGLWSVLSKFPSLFPFQPLRFLW